MSNTFSAYDEAVEAFHKWEGRKYGDNTPLADMHLNMWVEAYMLGYVNRMKKEEPKWMTNRKKREDR